MYLVEKECMSSRVCKFFFSVPVSSPLQFPSAVSSNIKVSTLPFCLCYHSCYGIWYMMETVAAPAATKWGGHIEEGLKICLNHAHFNKLGIIIVASDFR